MNLSFFKISKVKWSLKRELERGSKSRPFKTVRIYCQPMRILIKKFLLKLIYYLERIEFKHLDLDPQDPSKKIVAEYDLETEVFSDSGFVKAFKYLETQPYEVWFLKLENGNFLDCADTHILHDHHLNEILVKDLRVGDLVMTSEGPRLVTHLENTGIPVSMVDLSIDDPDHRYYTNNILSHNSITSSIILVWYLLFNHDKNAMILANVGSTAEELMDKIKGIVKGLPWFLKPGMVVNNVMSMKFDNGCRAIAKTTTKTSAIGFTIHFLYMDEFAHIHPNFIESFFRSTYPTVSSSKVSRIIITSTPNGMNKFYELYQGALTGENSFNPVRVDWWQVPGRDEDWKNQEIANLGSEELFNQEYGNQFLSSTTLLLGSADLRKMKSNEAEYTWREIDALSDQKLKYNNFKWHPKFHLTSDSLDGKSFVISVDLASGNKGDYTVINIFRIVPLPKSYIAEMSDYSDEADFFGLLQVGILRDNEIELEDFKRMLEALMTKVFDTDRLTVILEMNFKGELLLDKLLNNDDISLDLFLHTKHTESARTPKPGIKYNEKNKLKYCERLRYLARNNKIILNEKNWTIPEMFSFGLNTTGTYSSQSGHDDVAMSVVNLSGLFESTAFHDLVSQIYDEIDENYRVLIDKKLSAKMGDFGSKESDFYSSFSKLL